MKSQQSTNAFVKETFMDFKTQLETLAKNHQASIQNLETKFDKLADKQFGRPSGSLPSNTQPNLRVFTRSGKSYNPPDNPDDQHNNSENPINFDSDDEDDEPTPQPKTQPTKLVKETPLPKPYKPKISYPQRLRKEKIEAQYGKFLDMIRAVRINVPLVDILARMPNYGKFLKELISNKHKIEQIFAAFLSDESSAMIQNKVPPKLEDLGSVLIPCNFNKTFSCIDLADLGARINLMSYSLYAKLSLETLKPTKMSVRLADRSFQYPVGIAENMLVEVDFDALLDEGSKILYSIEGTLLEEEIFSEFDEFMAMTANENFKSESDTKEPPFEKITINTDYKIKTSLEEPPTNLKLKPLLDNLEYVILEEPSFLPAIISSKLSTQNKSKHVSVLKKHKEAFSWKTTDIPGICPSFCKHKIQLLDDKKPVVQKQRRLNPSMQEVVTKEIVKLLDTGIIYPIADSPWVSLIHCVPKKGGITVVTNENDELVPTRTVTGWRVCIDYRKLNIVKMLILSLIGRNITSWSKKELCLDTKCLAHDLKSTKQKIDVILKLPPPTNIKGVRSFLGHVGFYRRFIKDFFKIARPITKLLEKDTPFKFDDERQKAFELLKEKLTCAPVMISLNWNLPFELMCDASDFTVGAVLEFDIEIKDRKGTENVEANHLSRIENDESSDDNEVDNNLPGETLMEINTRNEQWLADFANYLVVDIIPKGMTYQ
ncbi:reverse transcriptase domain-containing protein [Tanacetum coccineum]